MEDFSRHFAQIVHLGRLGPDPVRRSGVIHLGGPDVGESPGGHGEDEAPVPPGRHDDHLRDGKILAGDDQMGAPAGPQSGRRGRDRSVCSPPALDPDAPGSGGVDDHSGAGPEGGVAESVPEHQYRRARIRRNDPLYFDVEGHGGSAFHGGHRRLDDEARVVRHGVGVGDGPGQAVAL